MTTKKKTRRLVRKCHFQRCKRPLPRDARPDKLFCNDNHRKQERNRLRIESGLCRACPEPLDPNSGVYCTHHLELNRQYKANGKA